MRNKFNPSSSRYWAPSKTLVVNSIKRVLASPACHLSSDFDSAVSTTLACLRYDSIAKQLLYAPIQVPCDYQSLIEFNEFLVVEEVAALLRVTPLFINDDIDEF